MSAVVSVEGVSKTYRLGTISTSTVGEDLSRAWARFRGKPDPMTKVTGSHHARQVGSTFWALEDVSFDVEEGEVLGVIGRNGAGKSTLFKILSQITMPSSGQVTINGRIASLLEVGTGFHPELTGRENVFLNGAILGMTKAEIRRNFDAIVAFSECEAFIDTPVKRYSSGMYVRLAFAVAAHLESEILIVDEVLAVGDAQFQEKCLGKMKDVSSDGRTVLFVSHSMSSVKALCDKAVLLSGGKVVACGDVPDVSEAYRREREGSGDSGDLSSARRDGSGTLRVMNLQLRSGDLAHPRMFVSGTSMTMDVALSCQKDVTGAHLDVHVYDALGNFATDVSTIVKASGLTMKAGESATVRFRVDQLRLKPGSYRIDLVAYRGSELIDNVPHAGRLEIDDNVDEPRLAQQFPGVYHCPFVVEDIDIR